MFERYFPHHLIKDKDVSQKIFSSKAYVLAWPVNCVNLISRKTHKNTNIKIQQDTIVLEETITKYISLTLRLQQQNVYYGTLPKASWTPTGHSSHSPTWIIIQLLTLVSWQWTIVQNLDSGTCDYSVTGVKNLEKS